MEAKQTAPTSSTNENPPKSGNRLWWLGFGVVLAGMLACRLLVLPTTTPFSSQAPDEVADSESPKPTKSLLSHLLVGLLVFSAVVAVADAFRARLAATLEADAAPCSRAPLTRQTAVGGFKRPPLSRRCSLIDLTMSRHERREVTLHHHQPSSMPEMSEPPSASSRCRRRPPPLSRHSSFFSRGSECADVIAGAANTAAAAALRRPSLELSDPDASPDTRRRCSRLIRRH